MRKRLTAAFMCLCLLVTLLPATAFADGKPDRDPSPAESGLCEHHPSHDEACGYTGGSEGSPCTHEHDEACYTLVTSCVHEHGPECYPVQSVSENTAALPEAEEPAEAVEPTACTHVCSEESGCITKVPDCGHEHDEACGYAPAEDGTPCAYVCRICNPQDGGSEEETGPEAECICTELCTGDNINGDCPVCGAGGVDPTACKGAESQPDTQAKAAPARAVTPRIAYDILWIGNTLITDSGYWTTDGNGNLMASDAGNYNIAFNADTNTLTLNNANIAGQYDFTYNNVGAGIWAYSRSGAVSLNIQVTGNNVVSGSIGIYALSNGGEVSVTISGGGSLTASGSSNGLRAVSTISNAALAIEGTAVKASGSYSEGVLVQAGESSTGSLSVDGGSLTASGRKGILFPIGSPSLNVNDSTIVRASGGIAAGINEDDPVPTNGVGIVFNGSTGTVYGNASLQKDLIIGEGESLTLDHGANLNANGHNVIVDGGTLDENLANSLGKSVIYKVTKVELNKTSLTLDVNESETLTATITPGNATDQNVTWSSDNESVAKVDANGLVTAVAPGTATITVTTADSGKTATCTVTVNPVQYTVTVQTDGSGSASASPASAPAGTAVTLTADPDSGYRFKGWEVVSGGVTISGNQFTMPAGNVTVKAVFVRNSSGFVPTRPWKPSRPVEPEEPEEPETPVLNGWVQEDGVWYLYQGGSLTTGWNLYNGTWYYLDSNGKMLTGWLNLNGTWYYLKDWGGMATGWQMDKGSWYYFDQSGAMKTGWQQVNGVWYYLQSWGGMKVGWLQLGSTWYYLEPSGTMAANEWKTIGGSDYYFYGSGAMAANTYTPDGAWVSASGARA